MCSEEPPVFYLLSNETAVSILSFMGGFVDSVSFMKLFGIFTTMVTGNIIAASTTGFREGDDSALVRVLVTVVYALGVFSTTMGYLGMKHVLKINQWDIGIVLFSCEAAALAVAMAIGVYIEYEESGFPLVGSWQTLLTAGLLALAMSIHSAGTQDVIPNCPSTTMMTMNITKTSMLAATTFQYYLVAQGMYLYDDVDTDTAHILAKYKASKLHLLERVEQIVIFLVGVVVGAVVAVYIGFWSIGIPMIFIMALVVNITISKWEHNNKQAKPEYVDVECKGNIEAAQVSSVELAAVA